MSGNGRDSGEREGSDRQASRNGRSGNGRSGSSSNPRSNPNRTRPGGAFGPGGLIRPPLSDPNGAGRPSNPRSNGTNGRGANAKSTIGSMYAPRSNGANGPSERQPRNSSSRRSMGALARDLSRSMSRSLASIGATMGRAVRDAGRYEPPELSSPSRRVELPPDVMEQISENAQPYRRSRARMLARKWRLGRVRANPVGYAAGIAALVTLLFVTVGVGGASTAYGLERL